MATYTQIFYHIVFATKDRRAVLKGNRKDLYQYIWGILKNKDCHLYRIGGVEDHIHILTSLHPSISLADLIKDIKLASAKWIKERKAFVDFDHWQDGYGAFTCSSAEKDRIIEYIKDPEEHHRKKTSREELLDLLKTAGVAFDEKFYLIQTKVRPLRGRIHAAIFVTTGLTRGYSYSSPLGTVDEVI